MCGWQQERMCFSTNCFSKELEQTEAFLKVAPGRAGSFDPSTEQQPALVQEIREMLKTGERE